MAYMALTRTSVSFCYTVTDHECFLVAPWLIRKRVPDGDPQSQVDANYIPELTLFRSLPIFSMQHEARPYQRAKMCGS